MRNKKSSPRRRARAGLLAFGLALGTLPGCATKHLIEWSNGRSSIFTQPHVDASAYVQPAGLILALPITATWDVLTMPFQYFWDVFPYGPRMKPEDQENVRAGDH